MAGLAGWYGAAGKDAGALNPARHCLALYERSGTRLAEGLRGTFAVVVIDGRRGELHLITDRLGSRPLYYAERTPFLFATRMQAILDFPGFSTDISPDALGDFLAQGIVPGYATLCERVRQVPSGTFLTWDGRENHIAGRASSMVLLGTWLTLEVWLGRNGSG